MKYLVLVLLVAAMVIGLMVVASADSVTVQRGTYGTVIDAYIRDSEPPGGTTADADTNFGNAVDPTGLRLYADSGYGGNQKGMRHNLIKFDLSSIAAGSTIISATFGTYYRNSGASPTIYDLHVSQLQAGKSWVEGSGDSGATQLGDPTFNERQKGSGGWDVRGGTGALDIDIANSKSYTLSGGAGYRTIDVTSFVNGWVNGGWENNGMLMWGGIDPTNSSTRWYMDVSEGALSVRPYLTIEYTPGPVPEPGSLMALGTLGVAALGFMRRRRA